MTSEIKMSDGLRLPDLMVREVARAEDKPLIRHLHLHWNAGTCLAEYHSDVVCERCEDLCGKFSLA